MTRADIEDRILTRLIKRDALGRRQLANEINDVVKEIALNVSRSYRDLRKEERYVDLVDDKDIVPLPSDVWFLHKVDRGDRGTQYVPMTIVAWDEGFRARQQPMDWARCTLLPGGKELLLFRKPTQDKVDGLRLTITRTVREMLTPDQEPDLPEDLHRFVAPLALPRVAQHREAQLAHPEDVYAWVSQQSKELRETLAAPPRPLRRRMQFYRARR